MPETQTADTFVVTPYAPIDPGRPPCCAGGRRPREGQEPSGPLHYGVEATFRGGEELELWAMCPDAGDAELIASRLAAPEGMRGAAARAAHVYATREAGSCAHVVVEEMEEDAPGQTRPMAYVMTERMGRRIADALGAHG